MASAFGPARTMLGSAPAAAAIMPYQFVQSPTILFKDSRSLIAYCWMNMPMDF